jgi:hypothetical protein
MPLDDLAFTSFAIKSCVLISLPLVVFSRLSAALTRDLLYYHCSLQNNFLSAWIFKSIFAKFYRASAFLLSDILQI